MDGEPALPFLKRVITFMEQLAPHTPESPQCRSLFRQCMQAILTSRNAQAAGLMLHKFLNGGAVAAALPLHFVSSELLQEGSTAMLRRQDLLKVVLASLKRLLQGLPGPADLQVKDLLTVQIFLARTLKGLKTLKASDAVADNQTAVESLIATVLATFLPAVLQEHVLVGGDRMEAAADAMTQVFDNVRATLLDLPALATPRVARALVDVISRVMEVHAAREALGMPALDVLVAIHSEVLAADLLQQQLRTLFRALMTHDVDDEELAAWRAADFALGSLYDQGETTHLEFRRATGGVSADKETLAQCAIEKLQELMDCRFPQGLLPVRVKGCLESFNVMQDPAPGAPWQAQWAKYIMLMCVAQEYATELPLSLFVPEAVQVLQQKDLHILVRHAAAGFLRAVAEAAEGLYTETGYLLKAGVSLTERTDGSATYDGSQSRALARLFGLHKRCLLNEELFETVYKACLAAQGPESGSEGALPRRSQTLLLKTLASLLKVPLSLESTYRGEAARYLPFSLGQARWHCMHASIGDLFKQLVQQRRPVQAAAGLEVMKVFLLAPLPMDSLQALFMHASTALRLAKAGPRGGAAALAVETLRMACLQFLADAVKEHAVPFEVIKGSILVDLLPPPAGAQGLDLEHLKQQLAAFQARPMEAMHVYDLLVNICLKCHKEAPPVLLQATVDTLLANMALNDSLSIKDAAEGSAIGTRVFGGAGDGSARVEVTQIINNSVKTLEYDTTRLVQINYSVVLLERLFSSLRQELLWLVTQTLPQVLAVLSGISGTTLRALADMVRLLSAMLTCFRSEEDFQGPHAETARTIVTILVKLLLSTVVVPSKRWNARAAAAAASDEAAGSQTSPRPSSSSNLEVAWEAEEPAMTSHSVFMLNIVKDALAGIVDVCGFELAPLFAFRDEDLLRPEEVLPQDRSVALVPVLRAILTQLAYELRALKQKYRDPAMFAASFEDELAAMECVRALVALDGLLVLLAEDSPAWQEEAFACVSLLLQQTWEVQNITSYLAARLLQAMNEHVTAHSAAPPAGVMPPDLVQVVLDRLKEASSLPDALGPLIFRSQALMMRALTCCFHVAWPWVSRMPKELVQTVMKQGVAIALRDCQTSEDLNDEHMLCVYTCALLFRLATAYAPIAKELPWSRLFTAWSRCGSVVAEAIELYDDVASPAAGSMEMQHGDSAEDAEDFSGDGEEDSDGDSVASEPVAEELRDFVQEAFDDVAALCQPEKNLRAFLHAELVKAGRDVADGMLKMLPAFHVSSATAQQVQAFIEGR
jgi:hypothetical protein